MATDHNPLFEYFVKPAASGRDRLEGLVAYALYKQAKKEWAASKSEKLTPDQLKAYVETWTTSPSRLEGLTREAQAILDGYGNSFVDAARAGIREDALRGTFWGNVRVAMTAAFLYTIFLIAVAAVLHYSGVDFIEMLHRFGTDTK